MKNLMIFTFVLITTLSCAQQVTTWVGGTPGMENVWNEPRNWDNYRTPDENSHVIIKASNSRRNVNPIIKEETVVASIKILDNASLTIQPEGELTLDGTYTYSEGISIIHGSLKNYGSLYVYGVDDLNRTELLAKIENRGNVFMNNMFVSDKNETIASSEKNLSTGN